MSTTDHSGTAAPVQQSDDSLDELHHTAIVVNDVPAALAWYREQFRCRTLYEDETWALLKFANTSLALVTEGQHPPHCGFVVPDAEKYGDLKEHRDGTKSIYIPGPDGNTVEILADNEAIRNLG